jgi:hypothetical protein
MTCDTSPRRISPLRAMRQRDNDKNVGYSGYPGYRFQYLNVSNVFVTIKQ